VRSSDQDLVERSSRGDAAAFEELYKLHAGRIYNLACRLTGSIADGEDLLQEIFVTVYRKLGSFKGESSFGTWIYRLATNQCLDFLRSRQGKTRQVTESLDVERAIPAASTPPLQADRLDLERAIAQLPPGYRAAFVLHDVEGFGHGEVAEMLGIAEGTSKSQVHKARLKIREYLTTRPSMTLARDPGGR